MHRIVVTVLCRLRPPFHEGEFGLVWYRKTPCISGMSCYFYRISSMNPLPSPTRKQGGKRDAKRWPSNWCMFVSLWKSPCQWPSKLFRKLVAWQAWVQRVLFHMLRAVWLKRETFNSSVCQAKEWTHLIYDSVGLAQNRFRAFGQDNRAKKADQPTNWKMDRPETLFSGPDFPF